MPLFMLQAAYAPKGWRALVQHPQNRIAAVSGPVERLGGKVVDGWMQFGEHDVLLICDLPNTTSAAALSMAISSGGAVDHVHTTQLMTIAEGLDALRLAHDSQYQPPESDFPYHGA